MFVFKGKYNKQATALKQSEDRSADLHKENQELRLLLEESKNDFEIYQRNYDKLYAKVSGKITDENDAIKLSPEQVKVEALSTRYIDIENRIPQVVDTRSEEPVAVILGAGQLESIKERKIADGSTRGFVTVVVDGDDMVYAYGDGFSETNDHLEFMSGHCGLDYMREVYVLDLELPKCKPNTIKV